MSVWKLFELKAVSIQLSTKLKCVYKCPFFKYYQNRQQQYIMYIKYKLFVTIAYQAVQSKLIDFYSFISQYINFEIKT